jgi:type IV pilus assembly protein PilB
MGTLVKEGSLGSILFGSQIISEQDIAVALTEQQNTGCRFGEALVKLGIVTQEDIDWALANQLNIPYVRLKKELVDRAAVELVPASLARRYGLLPLIRIGDDLSVAMTDPLNQEAVSAVAQRTGCRVTVSVALLREMREMQEFFYGPPGPSESLGFSSALFPAAALEKMNADLSGTTFVDYLLLYLVQNKLTALALQPVRDRLRIVARKAGQSREVGGLPLARTEAVLERFRRLSGLHANQETFAKGTISFSYKGREIFFQVLLLRGEGGDCLSLKLQILSPFPTDLKEFGVAPAKRSAFQQLAAEERGLVLFAVHDGEERARLVDLFLDSRETQGKQVMLLGDGLGRGEKGFVRIPCHDVRPTDFNSLLMATLDHEPDIIAIEDATDNQVFIAAGKAAMRGKLVLAGVAFNDLATLFRHLQYFWQRHHFIPAHLRGIVSCRGVLTLCPHCREQYLPSADELGAMALAHRPAGFFRATGCAACEQTGYGERKFLLDVVPFTPELLAAFEAARDGKEVLTYLRSTGHQGLEETGAELLAAGEISPAEYVASILL